MAPLDPRVRMQPPLRWVAVLVVVGLFLVLALVYFASIPSVRSLRAEAVPGAAGVELACLPDLLPGDDSDLAQVIARNSEFHEVRSPEELRVMNAQPHTVRWFRLRLENAGQQEREVVLDMIWRIYDRIELYEQDVDGSWKRILTGATVSIRDPSLSLRKSAFDLILPPDGTLTVYLRCQDYYRLPTQFRIWNNPDAFARWERFDYAKSFGYFAFWIAILAGGLFLYAMVRESVQLHFVGFAFFLGGLTVVGNGTLWLLVPWPVWPMGEVVVIVFAACALYFLCRLNRSFLALETEDPGLDRLVRRIQWLPALMVLSLPAAFFPASGLFYLQAWFLSGILVGSVVVYASLRRWLRGDVHAPFFLLSFLPYFCAMGLRFAGAHDTHARDDETRLISLMANALTLLFLSFASAYRYRIALAEKQSLQSSYQEELESEVAARTKELHVLAERLQSALSDRERIMAIIGHDLRVPAVQLHSLCQILTRWPGKLDAEDLKHHSNRIRQACDIHLELLNNLMMLRKGNRDGAPEDQSSVNVLDSVQKALEVVKFVGEPKGIVVDVDIPPDLELSGDPAVVSTILRNLLTNAFKYSERGGKVRVQATLDGAEIKIRVSDLGVGMPPELLAKVTRSLVESSVGTEGEPGAGVGLKLCHELAVAAGGDLSVSSELGKGTEALIVFPAAGRGLRE